MFDKLKEFIDGKYKEFSIAGITSSAISALSSYISSQVNVSILLVMDDTVDISYLVDEILFWNRFYDSKAYVDYLPPYDSKARSDFFYKLIAEHRAENKIIIVNNSSLTDKTISKKRLGKEIILFKKGQIYKRDFIIEQLLKLGYTREEEVTEIGEFSVKGEILDIWPISKDNPFRIVFDDECIEFIYKFDALTQRSSAKVPEFNILPIDRPENQIVMDYFDSNEFMVCYGSSYCSDIKYLFKKYRELIVEPFTQPQILDLAIHPLTSFRGMLDLFYRAISDWLAKDYKIYIISYTEGESKKLRDVLQERFRETSKKIRFLVGNIRSGFISYDGKIVVISEGEIFNRSYKQKNKEFGSSRKLDVFTDSMIDYKIGDYVVHANHGLGKFLGFQKIEAGGNISEYIAIEYLNNDKLYVSVNDFNLIHKYSGPGGYAPKLDVLGGNVWKRNKKRIQKKILEMAHEIIVIQAKRKTVDGIIFKEDPIVEKDFFKLFPYEETPDQEKAINEVLKDMELSQPMERLVCGDVGYGKTEVAIRAAFRAVNNGKQVLIISPTTILTEQHFNTFSNRFFDYPIYIAMLSRFCSAKKISEVKRDLGTGKIDIVISTHSILRSEVRFRDLGLVIIDEEHRFGVKDKEKMKRLCENVDILMLSATPIPRTMSMALSGIKDVSVIETAPPNRKTISTYIGVYDKNIIRDSINFEMSRGGQVFYIYNRIQDIKTKYLELEDLVPGYKIGIIHGQMPGRQIESVMKEFLDRKLDILLATTIVESGLDIPSVNMMIIDGVETMGLAQLYQLRGRVGRGYEKAFCYMFYPYGKRLTDNAIKRLQAVQNFTGFGAGFRLALRDLEIRGAGNILGKQQHGYVKEIGFELYLDMLNKALSNLDEDNVQQDINPEIDIGVNAYLPDTYIKHSSLRMAFYKTLLNISSQEELSDIETEFMDRFGKLPRAVRNILHVANIRLLAKKLRIVSIKEKKRGIYINFDKSFDISVDKLLKLVSDFKDRIKFDPDNLTSIMIENTTFKKTSKLFLLKKILHRVG